MSFQLSTTVRNAILDQIETAVGTSPVLNVYSGSEPANCAAGATGTLLATGTLPSDWMNDASAGAKTLKGTWTLTGQVGAGSGTNAGYYRLMDSSNTTCHAQGNITATGGGGDMTMDNINIANTQVVNVTTFTINAGNA